MIKLYKEKTILKFGHTCLISFSGPSSGQLGRYLYSTSSLVAAGRK